MGTENLFALVLNVIKNKYIIFIFIAVFLYLSFFLYVVNYRKKPRKIKVKKLKEAAPPKPSSEEEEDEADDEVI